MKRLFFYGLISSLVSHILCILLAMAFVNALNEAARDSDVIRMFAEGKGYRATVKCQLAFRFGAFTNLISVAAVAYAYLGAELLVFLCLICPIAAWIYVSTCEPLFHTASIVEYWRTKGHETDPFDLSIPVDCMLKRSRDGLDLQSNDVKRLLGLGVSSEADPNEPDEPDFPDFQGLQATIRRKKAAQVRSKTMGTSWCL